ncbi:uncharacterized protein LOC113324187 [Papaver somniferum]|uniref:uncharacterized protein LOC113324187 n=1 Tax=Papaver somniferum TaxID=3469 RepID=UPI000E6F81AC|nr:uncharacterized protein LOC113324187 [Papaver somniferum]
MGQICDALNEREKGKLPSQPQQNPKSAFQASTSGCNESSQYQVNVVATLLSGKVVDNNVAIKQIPAYAKFLKDLCTHKRKHHVHKRAFLTEQLGLGKLKPTLVTLQLADRSVKIPRGIVEDVLIKVDKFYFPVDFIVLDTQPVQNPDCHIPVILGRPFLATFNAIINYRSGILNLSFGKMTVDLNVFHVSQQPMEFDDGELHAINMIESLIQDSLPDILSVDPFEVHSLLESAPLMDIAKWQDDVEPLLLSDSDSTPPLDEAPKLDLKPLPDTLKYAFLGPSDTLSVIIASCLDTEQEIQLLEVLKEQ